LAAATVATWFGLPLAVFYGFLGAAVGGLSGVVVTGSLPFTPPEGLTALPVVGSDLGAAHTQIGVVWDQYVATIVSQHANDLDDQAGP
jgi:hypothetical protein